MLVFQILSHLLTSMTIFFQIQRYFNPFWVPNKPNKPIYRILPSPTNAICFPTPKVYAIQKISKRLQILLTSHTMTRKAADKVEWAHWPPLGPLHAFQKQKHLIRDTGLPFCCSMWYIDPAEKRIKTMIVLHSQGKKLSSYLKTRSLKRIKN